MRYSVLFSSSASFGRTLRFFRRSLLRTSARNPFLCGTTICLLRNLTGGSMSNARFSLRSPHLGRNTLGQRRKVLAQSLRRIGKGAGSATEFASDNIQKRLFWFRRVLGCH